MTRVNNSANNHNATDVNQTAPTDTQKHRGIITIARQAAIKFHNVAHDVKHTFTKAANTVTSNFHINNKTNNAPQQVNNFKQNSYGDIEKRIYYIIKNFEAEEINSYIRKSFDSCNTSRFVDNDNDYTMIRNKYTLNPPSYAESMNNDPSLPAYDRSTPFLMPEGVDPKQFLTNRLVAESNKKPGETGYFQKIYLFALQEMEKAEVNVTYF